VRVFPEEERDKFVVGTLIESKVFFRLFSHWNYQIRRIFVYVLLFHLCLPLLPEQEGKQPNGDAKSQAAAKAAQDAAGSGCWACFRCCFSRPSYALWLRLLVLQRFAGPLRGRELRK